MEKRHASRRSFFSSLLPKCPMMALSWMTLAMDARLRNNGSISFILNSLIEVMRCFHPYVKHLITFSRENAYICDVVVILGRSSCRDL